MQNRNNGVNTLTTLSVKLKERLEGVRGQRSVRH